MVMAAQPDCCARERARTPRFLLDPEAVEPSMLRAAAPLEGKRVLEIGAGNGRLSFRVGAETDRVVGIDLSRRSLAEAQRSRPLALDRCLHFSCGDARRLPFRDACFDIALLAWTL